MMVRNRQVGNFVGSPPFTAAGLELSESVILSSVQVRYLVPMCIHIYVSFSPVSVHTLSPISLILMSLFMSICLVSLCLSVLGSTVLKNKCITPNGFMVYF
jgi:hypothetical protein